MFLPYTEDGLRYQPFLGLDFIYSTILNNILSAAANIPLQDAGTVATQLDLIHVLIFTYLNIPTVLFLQNQAAGWSSLICKDMEVTEALWDLSEDIVKKWIN
jgi:hypothetical protein